MSATCNSTRRVVAAFHGGTELVNAISFSVNGMVDWFVPPRTGTQSAPNCKVAQATDVNANVQFLALATPIAIGTNASLILTVAKTGGALGTITIANMLAGATQFSGGGEANTQGMDFSYSSTSDNPIVVSS